MSFCEPIRVDRSSIQTTTDNRDLTILLVEHMILRQVSRLGGTECSVLAI